MFPADKRRHKRVPYTAPVTVRVVSCAAQPELEGTAFTCTTTDISEGGLRLHCDRSLPMDCLLELDVALLDKPFHMTGRVIWSGVVADHDAYTGVQFPPQDDERLWPWKLEVARTFRGGSPKSEP